jgi:hypothetical protein
MKKSSVIAALFVFSGFQEIAAQNYETISESELRNKISGYWIGQLVGNYMGWPFEFMYNDGKPIPILIDRYYTEKDDTLSLKIHSDRRGHIDVLANTLGGAWSVFSN